MTTGKTQMDSQDLYDTYGLSIVESSYKSLISYPPMKAVVFNDWPEENGIEVDLTSPVLDTKNVTLTFLSNDFYKLRAFYNELKDGGHQTFNFFEIGYNLVMLRMTGQQNLKVVEGTQQYTFSLTFSDDFPLRSYNYQTPNGGFEDIDARR